MRDDSGQSIRDGCVSGGELNRCLTLGCDLVAEELLTQDVRVSAVLSELAQHVEIDPPQRDRAAPVAVDQIVEC